MWPQIPEDLAPLSAAEVETLRGELLTAALGVNADPAASAEDRQRALQALADRDSLRGVASSKLADERAAADLAAAVAAAEDEGGENADSDASNGDDGGDGQAATETGTFAPTAPTQIGPSGAAPAAPARQSRRLAVDYLERADGGQGHFESWSDLAASLVELAGASRGASRYLPVAKIKGNYDESRRLGDDRAMRVDVLNGLADEPELTAAFCAPATPYYGISCMNTTRRPAFNSYPGFQETRMQVSIMPSPSLSDIDGGYGIWADTDDDDPGAIKDCAEITCGSPTTYKMYGIWRCLKVKNLMAMSYPELVEAFLNRLSAAHARLAETTLLEAMGSAMTQIDGQQLGYGGTTSILTQVLNYLALYQETQRWDLTGPVEGWAHRIVLAGIKMDIARRRQTDGKPPRIVTDAEVEAMFANVGVNIHWVIDTPSWMVAIPSVASGGTLNLLPQSVQVALAPRGKFAVMDRGELRIGVAPSGLYRDTRTNEDNSFRFFFENFEGLVNTNTCPSHILDIPVCWNGAQIDDIVINCQGGDEAGYQS